jgi:hypothetical protein
MASAAKHFRWWIGGSAIPPERGAIEIARLVHHYAAEVMKLKFEFVKLRYRGLKKNATRLFAVCALVNLYLVRKKLLRLALA